MLFNLDDVTVTTWQVEKFPRQKITWNHIPEQRLVWPGFVTPSVSVCELKTKNDCETSSARGKSGDDKKLICCFVITTSGAKTKYNCKFPVSRSLLSRCIGCCNQVHVYKWLVTVSEAMITRGRGWTQCLQRYYNDHNEISIRWPPGPSPSNSSHRCHNTMASHQHQGDQWFRCFQLSSPCGMKQSISCCSNQHREWNG